jgi:hypothetical protein
MGKAVNKVTDTIGLTDSQAGVRATQRGGKAALKGMEDALSYLKEADKIPAQYREEAMRQIADIYGFGGGGTGGRGQSSYMQNITQDPFYQMLSQGADESYLRGQSATGQLRGGASITGLAGLENQMRMQTLGNKLQGLQYGVSGLPNYTKDIYSGISGVGQQRGMNIMNVGQARVAADQAGFDNLVGLGKMASGMKTAGF